MDYYRIFFGINDNLCGFNTIVSKFVKIGLDINVIMF